MFKYKPHSFSQEVYQRVYQRQKGLCINCGQPTRDAGDHIVPQTKTNIRVYGEDLIHSEENCQIACQHCHTNKGSWSKEKQKALILKWEPFSKSKLKAKCQTSF